MIGYFNDVNDNTYSVKIGNSEETIMLGDSPFITEYEGGNSIYKPVRYSSSTVKLISSDFLDELYSTEAIDNKVELSLDNKILWSGCITPNVYNQQFDTMVNELEVECIDGLTVLKYYDYTPIDKEISIRSFAEILNHIISKSGCYTTFYINDNLSAWLGGQQQKGVFYENAYISELNFFDEDHKPMKMNEVLEEICKYCSLTAISCGDKVYLIDYNGTNYYYKYDIGSVTGTKIYIDKSDHMIVADDYMDTGTQISLGETYNKFTVKDSLYSFNEVLPDIFDGATNLNGEGKIEEVTNKSGKQLYKCFYKYYDSPNYSFHYYDKNTYEEKPRPEKFKYTDLLNLIGATPIRYYGEKADNEDYKPESLNFLEYILCHCHDTETDKFPGRPLFQIKETESKPAFMGAETYLVISGSAKWFNQENQMFIIENSGGGKVNKDYLYIFCELKLGENYWDSDTNSWTPILKYFKLRFDCGEGGLAFNKEFKVKNNVTWDMYLEDEKGFAIRLPNYDSNYVIAAKPILTVYQPRRIDLKQRCDAVWLSNFKIKSVVSHRNTDEIDSDSEYTNVLRPNEYIKEFDTLEFKICTWDNKASNYSSPAYSTPSGYKFLYNFYHKGNNKVMPAEYLFITKHKHQYETPTLIMNMAIKNDVVEPFKTYYIGNWGYDKVFMIDELEINWRYNTNNIKLVETK